MTEQQQVQKAAAAEDDNSWLTQLPYPTVHLHVCQYLDVWSLVALRSVVVVCVCVCVCVILVVL